MGRAIYKTPKFWVMVLSLLVVLTATVLLLTNSKESDDYNSGWGRIGPMTGYVLGVDEDRNSIKVDISYWELYDPGHGYTTLPLITYEAKITRKTVIRYEDGTRSSISHIKKAKK